MKENIKNNLKGIGCVLIVWVVLSILYLVLNNIS